MYSIDECLIGLTPVLVTYTRLPKELIKMLLDVIYGKFGICVTGNIGINMFL